MRTMIEIKNYPEVKNYFRGKAGSQASIGYWLTSQTLTATVAYAVESIDKVLSDRSVNRVNNETVKKKLALLKRKFLLRGLEIMRPYSNIKSMFKHATDMNECELYELQLAVEQTQEILIDVVDDIDNDNKKPADKIYLVRLEWESNGNV